MSILVRIGRKPRRKQASLLRVENRRQQRDHDKRPLFGIENLAEVHAAGWRWVYERCEHGLMGAGSFCTGCTQPILLGPVLNAVLTGEEPGMEMVIRYNRAGDPYYHSGEDSGKEILPAGVHSAETLEQTNGWRELVAKKTTVHISLERTGYDFIPRRYFEVYEDPTAAAQLATLETRLSGGRLEYFDLLRQYRRDWQPEVVYGSATGPTVELMGMPVTGLPFKAVDHRILASLWMRRRGPFGEFLPSVEAIRKVSSYGRSPEYKWTEGVGVLLLPERVLSQAPSITIPKPVPIPRPTWTPPIIKPEPVLHRHAKITLCPPMPASATYRYEVPKVQYRDNRLDFGFYGDGHSESSENRNDQIYPLAGEDGPRKRAVRTRAITFGERHGMKTKGSAC